MRGSSICDSMNEERKQVFIGNLSYGATEEDVRKALQSLNVQALQVRIPFDRGRELPKGFAFVDLEPSADVESVIKALNGVLICGRPCRADHVRSKVSRPTTYQDIWEEDS
jgi:RNA recognition motif-containing protein